MPLSQDAALNQLARQCIEEGWTVELTAGGHLRWTAPNGAFVFSASTPGDQRVYRNHVALLRRAWPEWRQRTKRPEDKPRRERKKTKQKAAKVWRSQPGGHDSLSPVPAPTLAAVWPADDRLTIPKPPRGW